MKSYSKFENYLKNFPNERGYFGEYGGGYVSEEPLPVYSIASGLDYPGVGPEHAYLRDTGRILYDAVSDEEEMKAFFLLFRFEGIIPAIESSHALAYAIKYAKCHKHGSILVCLSGRGDKDIDYVYGKYSTGETFTGKYEGRYFG